MNRRRRKEQKRGNWPAVIFAAVVLAAGIIWTEIEIREEENARYTDTWEITQNRNIEWQWAGKDQLP